MKSAETCPVDTGFRVYRVEPKYAEMSDEELALSILSDIGVPPSFPVAAEEHGARLYAAHWCYALICLEDDPSMEMVRFIAEKRPKWAVFRRQGKWKEIEEVFQKDSPYTIVRWL